jgi:hypothetical protein
VTTIIRRRKPPAPPPAEDSPFNEEGFVRDRQNWIKLLSYPEWDELVKGIHLFKTRAGFPIQYGFVTNSHYQGSHAWPACIAIRERLIERIGDFSSTPVRYGYVTDERTIVWCDRKKFPTFLPADVIRGVQGLPDFVLTDDNFRIIKRNRPRDIVDDDDIPF